MNNKATKRTGSQ